MAAIDDLKAARNNYAAILKRLTQDALENPSAKPTYSIDGKNVGWTEYQSMIMDKYLLLEEMIQRASGPFQYSTRMRP